MGLLNITLDVTVGGTKVSPTRITTSLGTTIRLKRDKKLPTSGFVYAYLPPCPSDGDTLTLQFWADRIYVKVPGDIVGFPGAVYQGLAPSYTLSQRPGLSYLAYDLVWRGGMYYIVSGS